MNKLVRRLGTFDAALVVMGGIIGSGIFRNPSVVAAHLHTAPLIMIVWTCGGIVALLGAFLFAELAARRPRAGGLYAYLRDALHPVVAFAYGWTLLLVSQSGGMAAAAVTFAAYFVPLTGLHVSATVLGAVTLTIFTIVNCLGVRQGASLQNAFMLLKITAIAGLIVAGILAPTADAATRSFSASAGAHVGAFAAFGLALVPVLFSYSGWQTASFMTAELKEPRKSLPRGLIIGVLGVVILYLGVNAVCLRALGQGGLASTATPASDVARLALGAVGERVMALVVAISTVGFLSNQLLVSPRVYYQMAADGIFFKALGSVNRRTHAPVVAIVLQSVVAIAIMFSQRYDQMLNYVTSIDDLFFGLAAISLFVFRYRDARADTSYAGFRSPLHPMSTVLFLAVVWAVVADLVITKPYDTGVGMALLIASVPIYYAFRRFLRREGPEPRWHDAIVAPE